MLDKQSLNLTSQGFDKARNRNSYIKTFGDIKLTVRQRLGEWEILISKVNSHQGSKYKQLAHGFKTAEKF